ncbi:MAG: beta-ketoacyl-ACP synthase III [Bacillota bacterium]|nr:beta-ketoacyl-ACP synthase III [Bacillota bacterium]
MGLSRPVGIVGTGSCVPERVLTNQDLEKMVDTSDEWITTRTGIKERRIADEETATSDLACGAAWRALESARIGADELDLIIVATVTPDMLFPATSCLVQARLGAARAAAFDLSAGCSGFVYALATGAGFIASGQYETVLVIGAETLSKITNWKDRSTCVLFGDAAGAAVLRPVPDGYGILSVVLGADGTGGEKLTLPGGGSRRPFRFERAETDEGSQYIHMCGPDVFKFAVRVVPQAAEEALVKAGLTAGDVQLLIPHQANIRIIDAAAERLGIAPDRVMVNVDRYGNTSAASIALALDEAVRAGRLRRDGVGVLVGFGAGLTWAAAALRWY